MNGIPTSFALCEANAPIPRDAWKELTSFTRRNPNRFSSLTLVPFPLGTKTPTHFIAGCVVADGCVPRGTLKRFLKEALAACGFQFVSMAGLSEWMRDILGGSVASLFDA
jgi:hypothetical protein